MYQSSTATESREDGAATISLLLAHLLLAGTVLVACALVTTLFAWRVHGSDGVAALISAAGVCWLGAALAMSASRILRTAENSLAATLLGMPLRTGLPLVAVIVVTAQPGALAGAGFVVCVVAYYAVVLIAETWLSLRLVPSSVRSSGRLSS